LQIGTLKIESAPAAQTPRAVDLLDRYLRGDFDNVVAELAPRGAAAAGGRPMVRRAGSPLCAGHSVLKAARALDRMGL
jgi:hypothetical protein